MIRLMTTAIILCLISATLARSQRSGDETLTRVGLYLAFRHGSSALLLTRQSRQHFDGLAHRRVIATLDGLAPDDSPFIFDLDPRIRWVLDSVDGPYGIYYERGMV